MKQMGKIMSLIPVACIIALISGCSNKIETNTTEDITTTTDVVSEEATTEVITEQESTEVKEEQVSKDIDQQELNRLRVRDYYSQLMTNLDISGELPNGYSIDRTYYSEGEDEQVNDGIKYNVSDIDGDGREELLLEITSVYTAAQTLLIYEYNPDTHEVIEELSEYPYIIGAYDNGILEIGLSHNQGMAGDAMWPYSMYKYNAETDTYDKVAGVDAWDGSVFPTGWDGESFPSDKDTDGDNILYSTIDYASESDYVWIDNAQYEEWHNGYINGANKNELEWQDISEGDIYSSIDQLNSYIFDYYTDTHGLSESDIGYTYVQNTINGGMGDATEVVFNYLRDKAGLETVINNEGMEEAYAHVDNEVVIYTDYDTMYALNYIGNKVGDITIFGLYPGMPIDDARRIIEAMNFTKQYDEYSQTEIENVYVTGVSSGHYEIRIDEADGKIKNISIVKMYSF